MAGKGKQEEPTPVVPPWRGLAVLVLAFILLSVVIDLLRPMASLSYSRFKQAVAQGKVEAVSVSSGAIEGRLKAEGPGKAPASFSTVRVEDPDLMRDLQAHGVEVVGVASSFWREAALWALPLVLLLALGGFRRIGAGDPTQGGLFGVGRSRAKIYAEHDIKVRFSDVAGVDEAKQELQEVIGFLRTPERFRRLGGKTPKGILLVGPPGTGKTLLARAVAGEAEVPFFSISGSEFVELFVGVGAARVRDLFAQAQAKAPCIIFIDELDALGKARGVGPMGHEEREQTLNQLLVEMDGFDPRSGVILMAATNRPEILDPALLRAGRFDRHVLVDRPDKAGRLAILKLHARGVPLESEADLEGVAAMTPGMVGAEMANLINEAALLAVRRGKDKVGRAELEEAVERVVAGLEKRNRVLSPAERERVAHHEVGHALVAMALPGVDAVKKISIIPRGISALGYTLHQPTGDRFLMTQGELENKIAMLLGGRVAEELVYQEVSTGAQDDLLKATRIARSMVKAYGMTDALGPVSFEEEPRSPFLDGGEPSGRDYSEEMSRRIDEEVRQIIEAQQIRVAGILGGQGDLLRRAAQELLARETLTGEELTALAAEAGAEFRAGTAARH